MKKTILIIALLVGNFMYAQQTKTDFETITEKLNSFENARQDVLSFTPTIDKDTLPEIDKKEVQARAIIFDRVRILQVSLALFYLREDQQALAQNIVIDILEDFEYLGAQPLRDAMGETSRSLKRAGPTFWEDTDRGNQNIYYSPDTKLLPVFNTDFDPVFI